ncbi:MAG: DUF2344 domain-containing protein, partial [Phycisphaerae bacterium]|nr:DUF2344 domain-containing protein [Phycisphaerae bacterium]
MSVLSCPTGLHRAPASTGKTPVAVEYALTGDLRFLSHHDEMRMLARAAIRARWPIAYSGGFNPIPRLSIALPRPVGLASQCQLAMIQLTHPRPADELRSTLNQSLPRGCSVTHLNIPGPSRAPQP